MRMEIYKWIACKGQKFVFYDIPDKKSENNCLLHEPHTNVLYCL
jgi:hypothetical protein